MITHEKAFITARSKLVYSFPFFGCLAMYLLPRPVTSEIGIETAGTDGRYMYYNVDWFMSLSETARMTVLAHEVLHPALGHVYSWRRGNRQKQLWNIAGDYVINLMLKEAKLDMWIEPGPLLDDKYEGMSTEQVYSTFDRPDPDCNTCEGHGYVKEDGSPVTKDDFNPDTGDEGDEEGEDQPGEGQPGKGQPGEGQPGKGQPGEGDGEGQPGEGDGGGQPGEEEDSGKGKSGKFKPCPDCSGNMPAPGLGFDVIDSAEGTTEEEQQKAQQWHERLISAAQTAKQRGTLPAGIDRLLDELLNPKLPWTALLSQLIAQATRDDYNMDVYDRRMLQYGLYLPDIRNEKVFAAVAVDTSGSMSNEEIRDALSESWGILRVRNVNKIRLLSCDAEVHFDKTYYPTDATPTSVPGGGGTSFTPVFNRLDDCKDGEIPACLIYFTDLYGGFPQVQPPYPVFWVTKTTDERTLDAVPFGKVLQYES